MNKLEITDLISKHYGISGYRAELLAESLLLDKSHLSKRALMRKLRKAKDPTHPRVVENEIIPPKELPEEVKSRSYSRFFRIDPNWSDSGVDIDDYHSATQILSGDYYELRIIPDGRILAIMCDVAGKGVPAAHLVETVANVLSGFYKSLKSDFQPTEMRYLAHKINDAILEKGLSGRFAAFTLALIDARTGDSHFLGAGDSLLHICRAAQGKVVTYRLPKSPPAGMFPSEEIDYRSGRLHLDAGDAVFLLTDGIEQSMRQIRDMKSLNKGVDGEFSGLSRIYDIINSVLNRRSYSLCVPGQKACLFDFSSCQGKMAEVVVAIIAVERVFRLTVRKGHYIYIDRPLLEFLQSHFKGYKDYFPRANEFDTEERNTVIFRSLFEDKQYDDMAILAIGRKASQSVANAL